MRKVKYGEVLTVTEDYKIETIGGGKIYQVKKGDKYYYDDKKILHYLTGEAAEVDHLDKHKDIEFVGYDKKQLAKNILKTIDYYFGNQLEIILEEYEIDKEELQMEIQYEILNVLTK